MGRLLFIAGALCLVIALSLFVAFLVVSSGTSRRLKKELDEEYKGYKR